MRSAPQHDCHVAFRLPTEDRDALRRIAQDRGEALSELLREMCSIVLVTEAPEPPPQPARLNPFIEAGRRKEAQIGAR